MVFRSVRISNISGVGTRKHSQEVCEDTYIETEEMVNGRALWRGIFRKHFLFYAKDYKNWVITNKRNMFPKGSGYLRSSNDIKTPIDSRYWEYYDDRNGANVWAVIPGIKFELLSQEDLAKEVKRKTEWIKKAKASLGFEMKPFNDGLGSRKGAQESLKGRYITDPSSFDKELESYTLYVREDGNAFLYYTRQYSNWVFTDKEEMMSKGMGFTRSVRLLPEAIHAKLEWQVYDDGPGWVHHPSIHVVPIEEKDLIECLRVRKLRQRDAERTRMVELSGFQDKYNGKYVREKTPRKDGRFVYCRRPKEDAFLYYTTVRICARAKSHILSTREESTWALLLLFFRRLTTLQPSFSFSIHPYTAILKLGRDDRTEKFRKGCRVVSYKEYDHTVSVAGSRKLATVRLRRQSVEGRSQAKCSLRALAEPII